MEWRGEGEGGGGRGGRRGKERSRSADSQNRWGLKERQTVRRVVASLPLPILSGT